MSDSTPPRGIEEKSQAEWVRQQDVLARSRPEFSATTPAPTIWTVRDRICEVISDLTKLMASSYAADISPMLKAASLLVEARKTLAD